MRKLLATLFKLCLVLFLSGGTCLVAGQIGGLLLQNGDMVTRTWNLFANPTFTISAIGGVLGFILSYFPAEKAEEAEQYASNEWNENVENIR
ncbi:hypothetical protein [Domibacillus enclensis]|uniref:Uncharacterized protein n=1 Tax=Domibacillus enclensis TaxID=1017273 RepID=A0A1N6Z1P4_9BACI|nr:hypothetical protein [Domibacillus enclensis]SIR20689.1 hypothetical protein SAMN05443094_10662 [Domibacillus enclensis]